MPQKDEEYNDYLADAFCHEAKKENDKLAIAAFVLGAGIWGMSGNMIAGLAVGAGILAYSDRSVRASNRNLQFIEENRVAAPFLPNDKFRDFERKFGRDLTLQQLKQAHECGLPIQSASEEFLFKHFPDLESPLKSAAVAPLATLPAANAGQPPQTKEALFDLLKQECPELLLLIKAPPIRLVGIQRTGKSTFARKLALLRAALVPRHRVSWATPHHEQDNPVPSALNPFGTKPDGSKDMRAIENIWRSVQRSIDQGQHLNLTAVWDEFGSYDQFSDVDCLGKSLKSLLREASKHEYYPILIAHGDQTAFYPGVSGILGTLKQSTVKVETIGEQADEFGSMRPTGEVEITWLDGSQVRFKVPDWLTVELLLSLQVQPSVSENLSQPIPQPAISENLVEPIAAPAIQQPEPEPDPWQRTEADLQKQMSAIAARFASGELPIQLKTELPEKLPIIKQLISDRREDLLRIVLLSIEKGYIKARHVQQTRKKCFENVSPEDIRGLFNELDELGIGEVIGNDEQAGYRVFSTDEREAA